MTFDKQETLELIKGTREFVKKTIAPSFAQAEKILKSTELYSIASQIKEVGFLSQGFGSGLWEKENGEINFKLSRSILIELGKVNAGLAFHVNNMALSLYFQHLPENTALHLNSAVRLTLSGICGLFDTTRAQESAPYFVTEGQSNVFQCSQDWENLLVPVFDEATENPKWLLFKKNDIQFESAKNSHGLDEVSSFKFLINDFSLGQDLELKSDDAIRKLTDLIFLSSVAPMLIAYGSSLSALEKARKYSVERKQGGVLISKHPAVQQLLGSASVKIHSVGILLEQISSISTDISTFSNVLKLKALSHTLLCESVTDCLQVFGGYGYMKDYGVEKILRDNNQLKLSSFTPSEIHLFLGSLGGKICQ